MADVFPGVSNLSAAFTADDVKIPTARWMGVPLLSDSFNRADGAITQSDGAGHLEATGIGSGGSGRAWGGATWTIAGNKAVNTPGTGEEKVSNGSMEAGDPPTGWAPLGSGTVLSAVADERTGGAGAKSLNVVTNAASKGAQQNLTTVVGAWYRYSIWRKRISGAVIQWGLNGLLNFASTPSGDWVSSIATRRAAESSQIVVTYTSGGVGEYRQDDVSAKPITAADLFNTVDEGRTDGFTDVTMTACPNGVQGGIAARIAADASSGIIAYQDGANVKVDECVAGTYNPLASVASAFAAGDTLRLDLDGAAYRLYKIVAAGTATLISAGTTAVTTGTRHGLFATDPSVTIESVVSYPKKGYGVPA
jgi:hypothetical protein